MLFYVGFLGSLISITVYEQENFDLQTNAEKNQTN